MGVTAGIFLASILLEEMRYLVYIRHDRHLWLYSIAYFQSERAWIRVPKYCNNQHKTHIIRKSTLTFTKSQSLMFVGSMLIKIQPFKNKITNIRNVWITGHLSGPNLVPRVNDGSRDRTIDHFLVKFGVFD
jgi:hypothetical protein